MSTLERAITIAAEGHAGQAGAPLCAAPAAPHACGTYEYALQKCAAIFRTPAGGNRGGFPE